MMYVAAAIHGPIEPVSGKYSIAIYPPPTINTQLYIAVTTPGHTVSPAPRSAPAYTMPSESTVWNSATRMSMSEPSLTISS